MEFEVVERDQQARKGSDAYTAIWAAVLTTAKTGKAVACKYDDTIRQTLRARAIRAGYRIHFRGGQIWLDGKK